MTAGELLPWAALFHLMFSVWAFSWAKWPQTADSVLASSIFGTYVRKVGKGGVATCFLKHLLQPHAKWSLCVCEFSARHLGC